ncbi:hypothetical protein [Flavobacterium cerinum]|uniref:Uncharacterized protein n=1 Tax=Flavobacterium cerinum TaxID=2502784 RepID=A0ABY5ITF9_9FLAO|nr:hypothetical protein [Flavobacterium cerinum]UUC45575.1 hypothetical protein NOX80_18385 [Flavobacterium cerinum]
MEQSKLAGGGTNVGGGWLSRQFRRVSSLINDSPFLRFFFGNVSAGLEVAADLLGSIGLKTASTHVELNTTEEQQLNNWADNFLVQLKPKLEQFARASSDQSTVQSKIDLINDMYRQLGAIQAHFSAGSSGMTINQTAARKQFVNELTNQIRMVVELQTTLIPVPISINNKNIAMNSVNTNGITANSSVVSFVTPQVSTNVKTGTVNPELVIPTLPNLVFNPDPSSAIKDVADSDPIKTDPTTPVATNPTNVATPGKKKNVLLKGLGVVAAGFILYKIFTPEKKATNKNTKQKRS